MKRREFITLVGGAAAAWPLAARGEPVPVIGVLGPGTADEERHRLDAFKRGLGQAGYVEGQTVGKGNGVNASNGSSQSARKNTASVGAEPTANNTTSSLS
jgi:hypothetical protein